jgi:anaerobic selenocysteine-containing dehydrogenase
MGSRISDPYIEINTADAAIFNLTSGDMVSLAVNDKEWQLVVHVSKNTPQGAVLIPRSMDGPILRDVVPVNINTTDHESKE